MNISDLIARSGTVLSLSYQSARAYVTAHKILSAIGAVILVIVLWWGYSALTNTSGIPSYSVADAQTGTLIVSVTGTGQVSASNTLSLSPQASGKIVYIGVADGQFVRQGTLIAEVDPTNANKAVRDAKASLENAQLSLQKLTEPPTVLATTQAQNSLAQAQQNLAKDYTTASNDVSNAFINLPSVMSGLQGVDFNTDASHGTQWNIDYYEVQALKYSPDAQSYRDNAYNSYNAAKVSFDQTFNDFKNTSRFASASSTEALAQETYATTQLIAEAVKDSNALIQFYENQLATVSLSPISNAATHLASLNTYTGQLNTVLSSLLGDINAMSSDEGNVTAQTQSLQQLQSGADPLSIQEAQLAVVQQQNALQDAQDNLANYYVTAPFDGTVALSVTPYQTVSSGTTVATLVTSQQLAEITLNEVDAAKVKVGDKATLTFDALPNVTIAGSIADISPVGTVSQGVVSYTVKIAFATQNTNIMPGMSVSAAIVTNVDQNVLLVPSGAVHTSGANSYVLAFEPPLATTTASASSSGITANAGIQTTRTPVQIPVTIGLSDDTNTEILSGIAAGQQVVTHSTANKAAAAPTTSSAARGFGGGGAMRL